jgi:hypothetical protein
MRQKWEKPVESQEKVYRIPIDPDGKQILVFEGISYREWENVSEWITEFLEDEDAGLAAVFLPRGAKVELIKIKTGEENERS